MFIFFAYPTHISGDEVWISNLTQDEETLGWMAGNYTWAHDAFSGLFSAVGWSTFPAEGGIPVVDGYTGATPLSLAKEGGMLAVNEYYSNAQMFWGAIPGSIGESSKILVILGALFLIFTGIASWRIMLGVVIGAAVAGMLINLWGATPFMTVPWYYHFIMGSLLFSLVFMATDPVSSANTFTGKWIYGILIGVVGMVIRVLNPAYPEGWMLAILFMNVFAPLIDHYVYEGNMKRRQKRALAMAKARAERLEGEAVTAPEAVNA